MASVDDTTTSGEVRLLDAALACLARWGVAKTTLDDIAREAGVSRATAYRLFPGGKDTLLDGVVAIEVDRFAASLRLRLAEVDDLEDLLVEGMAFAAASLRDHGALRFVTEHEPERILPHVSFGGMDALLAGAAALAAPHLARFLDEELALRTGEWVTRLVISYSTAPSPTVDLADPASARRVVRTFLLPGLEARRAA